MSLNKPKQRASQLSLEQHEPLSPAWQLEIERRLEDVRFGRVQTLTHEEFWRRVRASRT